MTLEEINDFLELAKQRLSDAQAQSMSASGRSAANYDLDKLRKDVAYWQRQKMLAGGGSLASQAGF